MRKNGKRMEGSFGNGCEGKKAGLVMVIPADVLELAGFSSVTSAGELDCFIEEGRIVLELPDEEDEAEIWDALRDELPVGICALLEDLGADPEEVWDILEEEAE